MRPPTEWQYRQIFFQHQQPTPAPMPVNLKQACDTLLSRWVDSWIGQSQAQRWIDEWFFIRYGEQGYHLRLRLHNADQSAQHELDGWLDDGLLAFFQQHAGELGLDRQPQSVDELYRVGYVRRSTYEPEYAKYGGSVGVELAEEHFTVSSDTCVGVIQAEQQHSVNRSLWALELINSLVRLYDAPLYEQALLLKSNAAYWLSMVVNNTGQFRTGMEANYQRQRQSLAQRFDADGVGSLERKYPAVFAGWNRHARQHLAAVRQSERRGELHTSLDGYFAQQAARFDAPYLNAHPISSYLFMPNYIHLLQNRLGLTAAQEMQLSYLLARRLEENGGWSVPEYPLILEPS
jgi:hypothetical protein